MNFSDSMALIANIIAAVGGAFGVAAFFISRRADVRATRAEVAGAEAAHRNLWSDVIIAVQEVLGASTLHEPFHPIMVKVRTTMTELVDGVPDGHADVIGRWLSSEHRVLNLLLERAMVQLDSVPQTVDNLDKAHRPPNDWAASLLGNLRTARKREFGPELDHQLVELAEHAEGTEKRLSSERYGGAWRPSDPRRPDRGGDEA